MKVTLLSLQKTTIKIRNHLSLLYNDTITPHAPLGAREAEVIYIVIMIDSEKS